MIEALILQFEKHLDTLGEEITKYKSEEALWKIENEILNSGGNLCLHLCGNLQHFIGTVLGSSGYLRHRDSEFNDKNVPKQDLLILIEQTKISVNAALSDLDPETLSYEYPLQVFGKPISKVSFLLHLLGHLGYHLGQLNYHRRLLDV